jgi:ABC-type transport system involved in cytochrome bd biosynthesis fused ATPase/permease subunit
MVRDADHVIVLAEGRVEEAGTPAELLEKGGWFARFAAAAEEGQSDSVDEYENPGEDEDDDDE